MAVKIPVVNPAVVMLALTPALATLTRDCVIWVFTVELPKLAVPIPTAVFTVELAKLAVPMPNVVFAIELAIAVVV